MNVVGGSKREKIVESRLGSIEKNQNRNVKGGFRPKKRKEEKWFYPKLELKIKEKIQGLDEERGNGREIHIKS